MQIKLCKKFDTTHFFSSIVQLLIHRSNILFMGTACSKAAVKVALGVSP